MHLQTFRNRLRHTIAPLAIALALGGVSLASAPAALALDTAVSKDTAAVRVRVLQSDMMVAALSCDLRNSYNEAIRRFQAELVLHGRNLRSYFNRVHGKRGQNELDRFVTAMANKASSRSIAQGSDYCVAAEHMMVTILALPPNGLAEFSRSVVDLAKVGVPGLVATALRPKN
jgi:hypothetical protein